MKLKSRISKAVKTHPLFMKLKFQRNNPFQDKNGCLLIFCCRHKVGTSWFRNIWEDISAEFGLPLVRENQSEIGDSPSIFMHNHSMVDLSQLQNYRGAHIIRDPRDIVLSGYYYHLWTTEDWAITPIKDLPVDVKKIWPRVPVEKFRDISYQEYLKSLSREAGILLEMSRVSTRTLQVMSEWDYQNKSFFEFKYEDIMQDEEPIFEQFFRFYGFTDKAIERSIEIAGKYSFKNRSNRNVGEVDDQSHLRSGKLQQWKREYNDEHKAYFKKLFGQDLIKLGYETSLDW